MSGPWTILENSKTSNTGYITAKLGTLGAELLLTSAQPNPATDPPTAGATSVAFNTEGYGSGVTIAFLVFSGTNIKVALDGNNDQNTDDSLWFEVGTDMTDTGGITQTKYISALDAYRSVRLRIVSNDPAPPIPAVTFIRLMANS
ncbi:hypothetical protein OAK19_03090 [Aureispira]|nr:hypothetical protein [Aureispira sp.]